MYKELIDKLSHEGILTEEEYLYLIRNRDKAREYAAAAARKTRRY